MGRPAVEMSPRAGADPRRRLRVARAGVSGAGDADGRRARASAQSCASPAIPARPDLGRVITLDDITELVTAQRSTAWADVARRIAHEIKNPLTPIQLSAERLKRRWGRHIVGRQGGLRPMHRHDHPPGRRHQAHGRRVLQFRPHAARAPARATISPIACANRCSSPASAARTSPSRTTCPPSRCWSISTAGWSVRRSPTFLRTPAKVSTPCQPPDRGPRIRSSRSQNDGDGPRAHPRQRQRQGLSRA